VIGEKIRDLGAATVLRVGNRVALPSGVAPTDLVGGDRYDTSALVAEYALSFGLAFGHVALVKGDDYPDALVVGPYLARSAGTVLLTRTASLPNRVRDTLVAHSDAVVTLDIVGLGPAILSVVKGSVWFPFPIEVGVADQVVTVASHGTTATVQAWERRSDDSWAPVSGLGPMSAFVGRNGVRADKREGDGATPAGTFALTLAFGVAADPGTALPYRIPGAQSYWVCDPGSAFYNTWREYDGDGDFRPAYGERLAGSPTAYRYALVIDYNRFPVVRGAGSAIFLHVSLGVPTSGCVSMAQTDVIRLLRWLDPGSRPLIAIR
jgi:L,D-peptidoglycan transpeptidase YkuD (ErfK/YbiS/YcfS/YnhG family)